jgi:branched-chain amino acid transport system substrate-binding protein
MKSKPMARLLTLVAVVALVTAACANKTTSSSTTAAKGASTIKVGVLLPLSGASASLGKLSQDGINDAVAYLNKQGGPKIEVVFADHQMKPDIGRAAAEKLIEQDKVNVIIGSAFSDMSLILAQVCAQRQIPCVTTDAHPDIVSRGVGWMFRPLPSMGQYATSLLAAYKDFGAPTTAKVAALVAQGDLGDAVIKSTKVGVADKGWELSKSVSYSGADTKDFAPFAQQLKAAAPNAVVALSYGETPQIVKAFNEAGFKPTILGVSSGWASNPLIQQLGAQADGIFASAGFVSDLNDASPALSAMAAAYQKKTSALPETQYWIFVGALTYVEAAAKTAGSVKPADLRTALGSAKMKFADPLLPIVGGVEMVNGENIAAKPPVLQIQGGKQVTVWPANVAKGKPVATG